MSITDMEYNKETKSLQVIIKFFVDDIELALEKENDLRLLLGTEKELKNADLLLKKYLTQHFIIEQDKGSIPFEFIGKEVDKDYLWAYIEYSNFDPEQESILTNTVLIEYFPDQTNKVNLTNGEVSSSFTLHKDNRSEEF